MLMIHVIFKENGIQVQSPADAENIATALLNAGYKGTILSYVEFSTPSDMLTFFKVLKLATAVGDPTAFEESITKLQNMYKNLSDMLNVILQKEIEVDVDKNTRQFSIGELTRGVNIADYTLKLDATEEKMKLTFNKR